MQNILRNILIISALSLGSILGAWAAGKPNSITSAQYPDVVYREGVPAILYPPDGDKHFLLPNGLPDVVFNIRRNDIHSPWYLTTFFGNKRIQLRSYDQQNERIRLMTGKVIQLSNWHSSLKLLLDWKETLGGLDFGGLNIDDLYQLEDGSFIGREFLIDPSGFKCNINWGVARFNSDGKVLWRKTYIHIAQKADFESGFWGGCSHYKGERLMNEARSFALLPDGNFAVRSTQHLIRINSETGLPFGKVPDFYVADSEEFVALKNTTYLKLQDEYEQWRKQAYSPENLAIHGLPGYGPDVEAELYRAIQNFLLKKNESATLGK